MELKVARSSLIAIVMVSLNSEAEPNQRICQSATGNEQTSSRPGPEVTWSLSHTGLPPRPTTIRTGDHCPTNET